MGHETGYVKSIETNITINRRDEIFVVNGDSVKMLQPLSPGPISPHDRLRTYFEYYLHIEGRSRDIACHMSLRILQLYTLNGIQRTYLSQNVNIADRHFELIIKQMTSKVEIQHGKDTTLLDGELLRLPAATALSYSTTANNLIPPIYTPVLL